MHHQALILILTIASALAQSGTIGFDATSRRTGPNDLKYQADNYTATTGFILPTTDLASGTTLDVGKFYRDTFSADRTLTFSGTAVDGQKIHLRAIVSATTVLTFPSSKRSSEANTTITAIRMVPGIYLFTWTRINSEWILSDDVGLANNLNATTDPTVNDDEADGYSIGSLWLNANATSEASGVRLYLNADASAGAAIWRRIDANQISDGDYGDIDVADNGATISLDAGVVGPDELAAGGITLPKFADGSNTNSLFVWEGTNWVEAILSDGLLLTNISNIWHIKSTGAGLSNGDKTDITVSDDGATFTIDDDVVGLEQLENLATRTAIARTTSGTGDPEAVTLDGDGTEILTDSNIHISGVNTNAGGWVNTPEAVAASEIDWSAGVLFNKTLAANTTFTFANSISGQEISVFIHNPSSYTVTWPTIIWPGGVTPTQSTNATDIYRFIRFGTNHYGNVHQVFALDSGSGGGSCSTAQDGNTDTPNGFSPVGSGATFTYIATPFVAADSYDACKVTLYLDKVGTPTFNVHASIWSDTGSNTPNARIGDESAALNVGDVTTTENQPYGFTVSATGLTASTKYWVVLRCATVGDASNYIQWRRNSTTGGLTNPIVSSSDGSTWNNVSSSRRSRFQVYSE